MARLLGPFLSRSFAHYSSDPHAGRCSHVEDGAAIAGVTGERDSCGVDVTLLCESCFQSEEQTEACARVQCHDCHTFVPKSEVTRWTWWDYTPSEGLEPLNICASCLDAPKHARRVAADDKEAEDFLDEAEQFEDSDDDDDDYVDECDDTDDDVEASADSASDVRADIAEVAAPQPVNPLESLNPEVEQITPPSSTASERLRAANLLLAERFLTLSPQQRENVARALDLLPANYEHAGRIDLAKSIFYAAREKGLVPELWDAVFYFFKNDAWRAMPANPYRAEKEKL